MSVGSEGVQAATPAASDSAAAAVPSAGSSGFPLVLALAVGVPGAIALAVAAAGVVVLSRRRRTRGAVAGLELTQAGAPAGIASSSGGEPALVVAAPSQPPALRVDVSTRRVYVHGAEAKPALSNEQFRLLSYLYERAGKVIGREELVLHVWPDAHAEGVSEEALDALVRRVRERLVQAGGQRGYIVTLRGQGFRLDAETG
ncbi:MAG: winged helix-turn-helix domain-containing protein [Chloroflexota bacterium]|nr:winged helix-turn-helix domain-containing protein [Chloroflexota bacterium]